MGVIEFMRDFKGLIAIIFICVAGTIISMNISGCDKYIRQDQFQQQLSIITNSVNVNVHNTLSNIFSPVINNGDVKITMSQTVYPVVVSLKDMKQADFTNLYTNLGMSEELKFYYSLPFTSQLFYRSYGIGISGRVNAFYPYPIILLSKTNN